MAITFQNQNTRFVLKNKSTIKSWIRLVIEKEKHDATPKKRMAHSETKQLGQINFVFTTDDDILKANVQFLKHQTFTDIITFDYCEGNIVNGDILISIERVMENARKFEVDFDNELKRVIIHGVLHLCGYKDKSPMDAQLMRKKENDALRRF